MPGVRTMPGGVTIQEARLNAGLLASKRWLVNLIFPPRCAGCGRVDTVWCDRCQAEIDAIPLGVDAHIREPLAGVVASGLHVGKLQRAMWALKYENTPELGEPLGERLAACFEQLHWSVDM